MKKTFATSIAMILVGIIIFVYSTRTEASGAEMFYGLVGCATLLIGGFLILVYEINHRYSCNDFCVRNHIIPKKCRKKERTLF